MAEGLSLSIASAIAAFKPVHHDHPDARLMQSVGSDRVSEVAERLSEVHEFDRISVQCQSGPGRRSHTQLSPQSIAASLIFRASRSSIEEAISNLKELIAENRSTATLTALISGLNCEEVTQILPDVWMAPFESIDLPVGVTSVQPRLPGMISSHLNTYPSAILHLNFPYGPVFEERTEKVGDWPTAVVNRMETLIDRLSVTQSR